MPGLTFGLALDFGSKLRPLHAQLERQSSLLEASERAGFEIVAAGETASPGSFHLPNALIVLATLAQRTRLRLCTGVALLPAWPVGKLALDAAELDQLTGGRLILGVGLGSPALQARAGWPADAVGETADETLECLRSLWSGATEYAGKYVKASGPLALQPINAARLPIWVGGAIRRSAARAARLGDGWYGGVNFRLSQLSRQVSAYGAANGAVALNRVTLLARNESELDELVQRHLASTLKSYGQAGETLEQVAADMALIGTPTRVVSLLERYQAAGATHIFARLSLDDFPPELVNGTIELLGKDVLPYFTAQRA